ncbi:MAG: aspartyl/glutamyl-tRNA amidotransferase subunit A [Candidatus Marsarchaeota archaeon]|nr:aspartyl/glutamyl-tRNA amidotransferase subunit A [Candidatus Marsarchaeota archaeon]
MQRKSGGALSYLPVSVKDCICTEGLRTTAGSRILDSYVPTYDATAVSKAKAAGGLILGKTAQDEFGFGTFSDTCAYSVPKNPLDPERTCGGSSGGAGCLTAAADFPHIAIAESTGGSITAPAAFTGTVGLTPTYGRVSRYGLIDYSNSMDKIGVIAREVYDSALMLSVLSGHDPLDSTSHKAGPEDFTRHVGKSIKGIKIGIPKEYFEGVDGKISKPVYDAIHKLEAIGAELVDVSLPYTRYAISAYYIIAMGEASTNLARYCGMRYGAHDEIAGEFSEYFSKIRSKGFGEEAKRRIILGTYVRAAGFRDAYYTKALKVRALLIREFKEAFSKIDTLATPSMPILPPRFDEISAMSPLEKYNMDKMTTAPNLCGFPTISVPAGKVDGLPVGMQLIADHFQEGRLISAASALEGGYD